MTVISIRLWKMSWNILEWNETRVCICDIHPFKITIITTVELTWKREQYDCWGIRSEARNILGVVTYMPGPSRWSLSQYKVRCGPFRLMSPYQRGGAIHPKVSIWKKEGIEEHSHRVWRTALYTLTQVLQILQAHFKTKLGLFPVLEHENVCSYILPLLS